jgi:hypothetical protein
VVDERDLGFGRKIGWPRRRVRRKMRGKGRGGGKKIGVERVGSHIFFPLSSDLESCRCWPVKY